LCGQVESQSLTRKEGRRHRTKKVIKENTEINIREKERKLNKLSQQNE